MGRRWRHGRSVARFALSEDQLAGHWAILDLEFVDTFAEVIVNGRTVAELGSTFIRHRIDVTDVLRPGDNEIAVRFRPAAAEAHERAAKLPFPVPWSVSNNRIADMNLIRKAQCHAGWDWGPCLMVAGSTGPPIRALRARVDRTHGPATGAPCDGCTLKAPLGAVGAPGGSRTGWTSGMGRRWCTVAPRGGAP